MPERSATSVWNAVCTWNPMLAHPYTETTINAAGYSIMAP
ncbi:hypothetical protein HMPREF1313_1000 [Bifidobacterium longum subsp. longum 1-6B]|uniref:Uncharacterized protein n=1 Tax=Bifidobacterium longum subsp. longum 1-6B TaxID=1161744 RepID=A0AA87LSM1_BIFLL|nr:hypothetical protein HMPREF1313_1000 [Bifidobacterium longum subsp. longum 1-6B]